LGGEDEVKCKSKNQKFFE